MQMTSAEFAAWGVNFLWPWLRIEAMLAAAPLFSARMVPLKVRLSIGLLLTWIMIPLVPAVPAVELISPTGMLISAYQILIGLAMGFMLQMVFSALTIAGESIAMSMGLGFASMIDPQNGIQVPVLSSYYVVIATLLFLALHGHLALIGMLVESFHTLPIAMEGLSREGLWQLVAWAGQMFAWAVSVALPALTSMLLVNLAFGIITRAAPQLNIFAVGFPMTLLLGFILLLLTLPGLSPQFTQLLFEAFEAITSMTGG